MLSPDDLIAALASAPGRAERAVIRIAGPREETLRSLIETVFRPDDPQKWNTAVIPHLHRGTLRWENMRLEMTGAVGLWPSARSFTGQPTGELHLPGAPVLVEELLSALFSAGARPAGPGEFTLRAFLAGRIDLVQAEAIVGVIDAGDAKDLDRALRQLAGGVSHELADLREDLMLLLADLEAGLDFVDEDIEFVSRESVLNRLRTGMVALEDLRESTARRTITTARPRVVLAGPPNAGKSTLFNRLANRDAAIVSEIEGTTRDVLHAKIAIDGMTFDLFDTAGFEETVDSITDQAAGLRGDSLSGADLVLWCTAADARHEPEALADDSSVLSVTTKTDIAPRKLVEGLAVSAVTGEGITELQAAIVSKLSDGLRSGWLGTTAARGKESVDAAIVGLGMATTVATSGGGDELIAAELRGTIDELGRILGTVYTDDLLDRIFSRFCIGK